MKRVSSRYDVLFRRHAQAHRKLFERVTLDLGGGVDRARTTESLLEEAAVTDTLPAALAEKIYDAGRYMFISAAGESAPNLQGIWTGTWKPSWSSDFTTDTNVQLAMKLVYSANLVELAEGYYRLIEEALPDFRLNARRYYGARGLMAPTRMSNNGLMLHWGRWNGIWWTSGAGWLTRWFAEHYRYTGDRRFLETRTIPLLKEVLAFFEDFMTVDRESGKYEFIPSYSPESSDGITSTMDVMVVRDVLWSLIEGCEALGIEREKVAEWKAMLARLPAYRINADGALAEWVPPQFGEFYRHRHLSHLHAAYEATGDLSPEATPELWEAAREATRRRINADGEQSSHGRMHMGLAAAYLRMAEEAFGRVKIMATRTSMYPSLITSHEPGQRIFNTDGNGSIPEIVNRMLAQSRQGQLDLLPALPAAWPRGEIRGILERGQVQVERLAWDVGAGRIDLQLRSAIAQTVALRVPGARVVGMVGGTPKGTALSPTAGQAVKVALPAGRSVGLTLMVER